jgi:cobalt/nickel transport system permease protein
MIPVWTFAVKKAGKTLNARQVPLLAVGAAFSFVIMMFNVPLPGGTTGHAVGGAILAILLGPWAACIALTTALVIQALLFGDGGITALGANCFNMAFVIPFAGHYTYRIFSGGPDAGTMRRVISAGAAGYIAINAAALCAGVELGLQPLFHHTTSGQPLYCPYGLGAAVPAMVFGHLAVFGWIEAVVTALVFSYIWKQMPELINKGGADK